jgi:hypothetical protein
MNLPDPNASSFREGLAEPLEELREAWEITGESGQPGETTPALLVETFQQLYEAMQRTEASILANMDTGSSGNLATPSDVSELGEYALEMFEQACHWAKHLKLPDVFERLQAFTISMALWVAGHDGQLLTLEPVVDALAQAANSTGEPEELFSLYEAMTEIMAATSPMIARDLEIVNPGRPWRLLNLNRAIVATRTHQPDIMEEAFSTLAEQLPNDAPGFFTQGMEQMDLLNYPPQVREVMDRYYRKWSVNRSLH